jgi:transketolase
VGIPRVAIEAGVTDFWRKYVGLEGAALGIDTFGESAPAPELFRHFGITVENAVRVVKETLEHAGAPVTHARVQQVAAAAELAKA